MIPSKITIHFGYENISAKSPNNNILLSITPEQISINNNSSLINKNQTIESDNEIKTNNENNTTKNDQGEISTTSKELNFPNNQKGRKKKNIKEGKKGKHNKFADDIIIKKVKHLVLRNLLEFINQKLKEIYGENIGHSILKKQFLYFNKNIKSQTSVRYNQALLNTKLGDIFSEDVSKIYPEQRKNFNKNLVFKLINENEKEKKEYFKKLFDLKFSDCLDHFSGNKKIGELDGMNCIDEVLKEKDYEQEYREVLIYFIKNFNIIINNKKSRDSSKKEKKRNKK